MECTNTPEYNQEAAFRASIIESLKVKVHDNLDSDIIQEDPTHPADEPSTPTVDDSASSYSQLSFSKAARIFQSRNKLQCFQFHPVSERNLVAAGSRNGHLALWDMVRLVIEFDLFLEELGDLFPTCILFPLPGVCIIGLTLASAPDNGGEPGIFSHVSDVQGRTRIEGLKASSVVVLRY